jgi:hypothetical protein
MSNVIEMHSLLLQNLLSSVMHFISRSGMEKSQIEFVIGSCLKGLSSDGSPGAWLADSAPRFGDGTVESAVLRLWHRLPQYIDASATPLPLRLYGRAPSVESLVRRQGATAKVKTVIRGLRAVGLIRRTTAGKYLPSEDTATIGQLHPLSIEHVAKSVMRLLGTVLRNTDPATASSPLIERSARVPDLSRSEAKAFAEFTHRQGLAYLQAVDDWLETRRVSSGTKKSRGKSKHVGAGVHLYAYMGNDSEEIASFALAGLAEGSSRHSISAARSGNRRGGAACTTSGALA